MYIDRPSTIPSGTKWKVTAVGSICAQNILGIVIMAKVSTVLMISPEWKIYCQGTDEIF